MVNVINSLNVKSVNLFIYFVFNVPKTTRLNNQIEYIALNTIEKLAQIRIKNLELVVIGPSSPIKIRNSPKKLHVPGKLILARFARKKIVENTGITWTIPPKYRNKRVWCLSYNTPIHKKSNDETNA